MALDTISATIAVTVTYGQRWSLLRQALHSLLANGVGSVIVVDNSDSMAVTDAALAEFGSQVRVIRLGQNTGSANGYKVGIEAAMVEGAEFILLLDDDNVLRGGTFSKLQSAFEAKLSAGASLEALCVVGFRPDHQPGVADGESSKRTIAHPDSFFGFHLKDLPYKAWKRRPRARYVEKSLPGYVPMEVAPYSGMFFHRTLIDRCGTPDPRLVLYADDTEFSHRITATHGQIWLVPQARIEDLEASWNVAKRFSSSFEGWLKGSGDLRAFYATRNQAWFERHRRRHVPAVRAVNRWVYIAILGLLARRWGCMARYRLLLSAIRDGESQLLGPNQSFPL